MQTAIQNVYDGPVKPPKKFEAKQFTLDFAYSENATEVDAGIRETARGYNLSIMAMGIALYRVDVAGLFIDLGFKRFGEYIDKLAEDTGLNRSTLYHWEYVGAAYIKYRSDLERIGFSEDHGPTKLPLLARALENQTQQTVFKNLVNMTFRQFDEWARGPAPAIENNYILDMEIPGTKNIAPKTKSDMGVKFPNGESWWSDVKERWQRQNYTIMSNLDKDHITQINTAVEQAVVNGWKVEKLADLICEIDSTMEKRQADLIARDQIGKLNSMATQARMQSVGLNMYIWETAHDERVRSTHAPMDGLLCRWDDADKYSADGGKIWIPRPMGAVRQHPGMDYQCRCIATTYWEELMGEVEISL
jgi:hypothetical protein